MICEWTTALTPALSPGERGNVKGEFVKSAGVRGFFSRGWVALAVLFFCGWFRTAAADEATPGFYGKGLCRFQLHQYVLPMANQDKINYIVGDLLKRHEEVFHFTASTNLHVRIHIFGTFEGYRNYWVTNHSSFEHEYLSISNLAGYYSTRDNVVVTWRQRDPTYLANNILHECSHAIMHQQYRELPVWLDEGCAVYFSYPTYMRDEHDDLVLKSRWYELRKWLDEGALPDLRKFLDVTPQQFQMQDAAKTYPVSWSIFQLLMSTPENRRALYALVQEYQKIGQKPPDCALLLNKFYPGGLAKMDKDWHAWIKQGAETLLGPPERLTP